jgi:hypothetical protein
MVSFVGHEDNDRSVLDLGFLCLYDFSPKPVAVGTRGNFVAAKEFLYAYSLQPTSTTHVKIESSYQQRLFIFSIWDSYWVDCGLIQGHCLIVK